MTAREGATQQGPEPTRTVAGTQAPLPSLRRRNLIVFACVAVLWLLIDIVTKAYFNVFEVGQVVAGPFLGLVQFRLVHNTGAAWGMFGDSTFVLGVLSVVVCTVLAVYLFLVARRASLLEVIGGALIWAGGIGNAIDRFNLGYVVDFIDPVFIDFPTFNVADIGVTCGFVLFFAGILLTMKAAEAAAAAGSSVASASEGSSVVADAGAATGPTASTERSGARGDEAAAARAEGAGEPPAKITRSSDERTDA